MKALLVGCSAIAARRAVPALMRLPGIAGIDAASRRGIEAAQEAVQEGTAYDSPEDALAQSDAELVYVSTENAAHGDWAARVIETGRHVVVDKPGFADRAETERLVDAAAAKGLLVAEATVFLDHPRIAALSSAMADRARPTMIQACFAFPPLPAGDFRYDPARGGGAIADLGPYAAATCRYFFGGAPDHLACRILQRARVETAFAVTVACDDGRCFAGMYGFDSEYQNWVSAAGPGIAFRLERFCTPPPGSPMPLELRCNDDTHTVDSAAGDSFERFFARVLDAIAGGVHGPFHEAMLADAAFRDRLWETAA